MTKVSILRAGAAALALATLGPSALAQQMAPAPTPTADALAAQIRILSADPRNVPALILAGELSTKLGDAAAALGFFARAQAIEAGSPRILAGRAGALILLERPGEALRLYDQAERAGLAMDPYVAQRGLAYDLIGQPAHAQRDYRTAIRQGDGDDETVRRLALSLGISGKRDEAMALLDPLLRRNDRGAWRARACILALSGDVVGAQTIAANMLVGGSALAPFFARLPALSAADRAFAVHFGQLNASVARANDARMAPVLAALPPEPAPVARAPVQVAEVAATRADAGRSARDRRRERGIAAMLPSGEAEPRRRVTQAERPPVPTPSATQAASRPTPAPTPVVPASRPVEVAQARIPAPSWAVTADSPRPTSTPRPMPAPAPIPALTPTPLPAPVPAPVPAPSPTPAPTPSPAASPQPVEEDADPQPGGSAVPPAERPPVEIVTPPPRQAAPVVTSAPPPPPPPPPPPAVEVPMVVPPVRTAAVARRNTGMLASIIEGISVPASELGVAPPPSPPPPPARTVARAVEAPEAEHAPRRTAPEATPVKPVPAARKPEPKKPEPKKPDPKKPDPALAEPARWWVQVAGGANAADLGKDWKRLTAKSPAAFKGRTAWTTPLRATNRLLAGPFKSMAEAMAMVNLLAKDGTSAFAWQSEAGQKVTRLGAK